MSGRSDWQIGCATLLIIVSAAVGWIAIAIAASNIARWYHG